MHDRSIQVGDVVLYTGGGPNGGCTDTRVGEVLFHAVLHGQVLVGLSHWPLKRASRERMERKGTKGNEIELKGTKRNEGNEMFLCATNSASSRPSCHGDRLRRPTIVECTYTNLALDRLPQAPRIAFIGVTCPMTGTLHACVFL